MRRWLAVAALGLMMPALGDAAVCATPTSSMTVYMQPAWGTCGAAALNTIDHTIAGTTAGTCDSSMAGALRYQNGVVQFCNGTSWGSLSSASAADSTGAVQFNAGSGSFGGDANNFYWDDTNKRLGIGTTNPNAKLDVNGTISTTGVSFSGSRAQTAPVAMVTGTYTGNGAASQTIVIGYRPKLVVVKAVNGTYDAQTIAIDGISSSDAHLRSYSSYNAGDTGNVYVTATGFSAVGNTNDSTFNYSGRIYYYFAIY